MFDLKSRVLASFDAHFRGTPDLITRAPGRVNLIGEHTDYNDGFVLPMAINCQTMVAARARSDTLIRVHAVDLVSQIEFSMDQPILPDENACWSNYVKGVAFALMANGMVLSGAEIAIAGDIPQGAGLSSSASLEMACGLAFAALAGHAEYDRTLLALAGQRAEHEFAGCQCGIMDQLVVAHGVDGHAALIDCRTLTVSPAPISDDWSVLIVHSGQDRGLADSKYNVRREQCEIAARHFGVAALRDLDLAQLEAERAALDPVVFARARHVISENTRTLAAANAMRHRNLAELGSLMVQSHQSMRDDFEITTPEIDTLVDVLRSAIFMRGGARMTGGGFGGAVVAVLEQGALQQVIETVRASYKTPAGTPPFVLIASPSVGASILT